MTEGQNDALVVEMRWLVTLARLSTRWWLSIHKFTIRHEMLTEAEIAPACLAHVSGAET